LSVLTSFVLWRSLYESKCVDIFEYIVVE
jgi:hypothetical protein